MVIDGGRVAAREVASELAGHHEIEAGGRVVIPGLVNSHVHLDKAFVGGLAPSGLMRDGVALGTKRKRHYTREDIKSRVRRALDLAVRHATTARCSPVDVDPIVGTLCVAALAEVREEYRDRIDIQVLAFPQEGLLGVDGMHDLMRRAVEVGGDLVGGRPQGDPVEALDYERRIDATFEIAAGRLIDMSVDAICLSQRSQRPDPAELGVYRLAEAVIRLSYRRGAVTARHVLALSAVSEPDADRVIDLVRQAGVNVITLPSSNLFTEGRTDKDTPRRGLTRVKSFLQAGVNVAMGTDNLDDTYLPFANMNPLLEAHVCACAAHLGNQNELPQLRGMITHSGAQTLAIERYGTAGGCRADVVVLETADHSSIVTTQPEQSHVIKAGRVVAVNGVARRLPKTGIGEVTA